MQHQMYSMSGEPIGVTEAMTINKPGQSYTVYGVATKGTKAELSAYMQSMLNDESNPDIQDYANKLLKVKG